MKKQVVFIHGGDSFSKQEDFLQHLRTATIRNLPGREPMVLWTQTLIDDLGDEYEVFMPTMPNKQNADYREWKIWFERHIEFLKDDVILVGWSLGGMFLAKYLSENTFPLKIKALFLLAAPCGVCIDEEGNDCGSFQFSTENLPNISKITEKVFILHSKDDFIVPFKAAELYKKYLPDSKLVSFEDKNHFLIPIFEEFLLNVRAL